MAQALAKLRTNLEQGQPYDGQQMFKTIYHRFRAQKKLQDCYKLLEEGARLQLQQGQLNCGVELAQMLVEVLQERDTWCALCCSWQHFAGLHTLWRAGLCPRQRKLQ